MSTRVYIAGPMTGLPEFNYPAFNKAAARLRDLGFHVENPAENPDPPGKIWEGYMRMAIAQLVTCDTIALLPGWDASRGARIEYDLAGTLGLRRLTLETLLGGQPAMTWHAIETAPKDGTVVDLWLAGPRNKEGGRETDCRFRNGRWLRDYGRDGEMEVGLYVGDKPTHWMLPPQPPTTA